MRRIAMGIQSFGFKVPSQSTVFNRLVSARWFFGRRVKVFATAAVGVFHDAALSVKDSLGEVVGECCFAEDVLQRAFLFLSGLEKRVVHELHAEFGPGLNGRADTERFVLANQV